MVGASTAIVLIACGSGTGSDGLPVSDKPPEQELSGPALPGEDPAEVARRLSEKPWEVVSSKGETYLPNVFYAEASQNEQIMPYAIDGHVMIDRLIYPTLGNPNLYTKSDAKDELVVVLRVEDSVLTQLGAKIEQGSGLSRVVLPNSAATGFAFFLIPRKARDANTESKEAISSGAGTDVVRIYPHEVLMNPEPADMPAVLKQRHTVRFVFRQGAMAKVPAGLYDLRFEVKKDNLASMHEYQYNAVRVFDKEPDEYSVLNITDTQVSVGDMYDGPTRDKLEELVQFLNTSNDARVRNASFVTFNGDLHNGGSPGSLRQRKVSWTYHDEAKSILALLKHLPVPIFLTVGNHDGYVSTGHVPGAVKAVDTGTFESLKEVVEEANPKAWPSFSWTGFDKYIKDTAAADLLGGIHRDIFVGGFTRTVADGFAGWKEVPRAERNYILYDGFYQWQKTYGPLYYSHKFGKNFYLSLNSFELRQHRRSGWGMYTVNYGGGMSDVQMAWLDRELLRAKKDETDVVVLAHHDPRGGHKGQDFGYYFEQLEYRSVFQSAINYLVGHVWNPAVCKLPDWALKRSQEENCVHDGLQEWMRKDPEFDKTESGIELMKLLAASDRVRTVLLGHTHYNELEVLQDGDELVPGKFPIGGEASVQKFATLEVENPIRGYSVAQTGADYDNHALRIDSLERSFDRFVVDYDNAVAGWQPILSNTGGGPREMVILRLVSAADMANQTYSGGKNAFGFSVLHLSKKFGLPQINRATFFANVGEANYTTVGEIDLDRRARLKPHDPKNPVEKLFDW